MLSRRALLAGAATVPAFPFPTNAQIGTLSTAVVGAGMSGLYCAYRLLNAGAPPSSLAVFEGSDRVGGRLRTESMPGADGILAEFGGMRFLTSQPLVAALITHLGLPSREFPMGGSGNLVFMRGKRWTEGDYARRGAVPFDLSADEAGLDPTGLMVRAINQVVPNAEKLSLEQWETIKRTATVDGKPLWA